MERSQDSSDVMSVETSKKPSCCVLGKLAAREGLSDERRELQYLRWQKMSACMTFSRSGCDKISLILEIVPIQRKKD